MGNSLRNIVSKRLEELGLGPVEAATKAGLERTYIRDIIQGKKLSVRTDKIDALASALQLDAVDLTSGISSPVEAVSVPLMGYVGAGSEVLPEFEQLPPDGLDSVELPFPVPDEMIAFKVDGDSMLPKYDPGDIIIVFREQRKPIDAFYGMVAAVRTTDGRRFIKTITRGSRPNRVNLASWNAKMIEDVQLDWIGEIFAVLPPAAVRTVLRQGGIQGQLRMKSA